MKFAKHFVRIVLLVLLLSANIRPVRSFSSGPYSHAVITRIALEEFTAETGWELGFECAQLLIQASIMNDREDFMLKDTYHCDNNNIAGCSYRLDQLKGEAHRAYSPMEAFQKMGMALHIVQDFYSHSNWPERFHLSMVQAPLELFKDIAPPPEIQTGYYPDIYLPDVQAQILCFLAPPEDWGGHIPGATHACMNKCSHDSPRGQQWVPYTGGMTYHELAAQYAIQHTVEVLHYYAEHNRHFMLCLRPNIYSGCGAWCNRTVERRFQGFGLSCG